MTRPDYIIQILKEEPIAGNREVSRLDVFGSMRKAIRFAKTQCKEDRIVRLMDLHGRLIDEYIGINTDWLNRLFPNP